MNLNTLGVLTITATGYHEVRVRKHGTDTPYPIKRRRRVVAKFPCIKLEDAEKFIEENRSMFERLGHDEMLSCCCEPDSIYVDFVHRMFDRHL